MKATQLLNNLGQSLWLDKQRVTDTHRVFRETKSIVTIFRSSQQERTARMRSDPFAVLAPWRLAF